MVERRTPLGSGPEMVPIVQDSMSTLIARQLRDAIARGEFTPGQQLLETQLALRLGVSRGPLREAMQRLSQEGLLDSFRNRGVFVMQLDDAAIADMFLARTAIERAALGQLIATGRHRQATVLGDLADAMDDYRETPSSPEVSQLDMQFHETLVALSESPRLQRMHAAMITQVRMCLTQMQHTYDSVEPRLKEHRLLAEAIAAGDAELADRRLLEHMRDGVRRLREGVAYSAGTSVAGKKQATEPGYADGSSRQA